MKRYFSFLICAAMLSFVACDKDDETPYSENVSLNGTMFATMPNSPSYSQRGTEVEFSFGTDGLASIILKGVKFAEAMPMTVDLQIDSVPYVHEEATQTNIFAVGTVVPKYKGQPMAKYTITELNGETLNGNLFSLSFNVGAISVTISNMYDGDNLSNLTATGVLTTTLGTDSTFTMNNIKVNVAMDEQFATFEMLAVKFAEAMPLTLDMTIDSVSYVVADAVQSSTYGNVKFSGNNLVPEAMGGAFPRYTITNLEGKIENGKFSFSMICGTYPVSYEGELDK